MKRKLLFLVLALVVCLGATTPTMASGTGKVNNPSPIAVSAGSDHSGLIDDNGSLWMWGLNLEGELGNGGGGNSQTKGDFVYQTVPVKVLDNVRSVTSSGRNTAAIKTDGSLWMWGSNYEGQFGNGSTEDSSVPVKVMDNVAAVSLGGSLASPYTAVIKTDGSLWMWGANDRGQLGKGQPGSSAVPVKVLDKVSSVSLSNAFYHVAAIKSDGSLWMWGSNKYGQLGNDGAGNEKYKNQFGDVEPIQDTPVKVMDNVASVSLGNLHSAVVKSDGSLWMWGQNEEGQLGNGREYNINKGPLDRYYQTVPVKVMDDVATISSGGSHTAAVKKDGSLWMFGSNGMGQLGTAYTGDRTNNQGMGDYPIQTIPVKLMDDVAAVSGGSLHTIIVKTDGSVWLCGRSNLGNLGTVTGNSVDIFDTAMQTIPVKLPGLMARMERSKMIIL